MKHIVPIIVAMGVTGCGSENNFGAEPPPVDQSNPRPPDETTQTDVIVQVTTPLVDILWTIDNSCSMGDEQNALTDNFPVFMNYFTGSGLDYHVGVVSTDMDNPSHSGKLQASGSLKYIDIDTPNATSVFTSMAGMGTSGSGTERGLGATFTAIELLQDGYNAGFYRDQASLHTVVISDEPDQTQEFVITQAEFVDWYDGLKREADERTFSSIVSPAGGGVYDGSNYLSVTTQIGGIKWDINNENWGEVLDRLGVQASGLKREYFLSQQPVSDTILVEVHVPIEGEDDFVVVEFDEAILDEYGVVIEGDWIYDAARNSITFATFVPEALSKVVLHYTLLAAIQAQDELEGDDGTNGGEDAIP